MHSAPISPVFFASDPQRRRGCVLVACAALLLVAAAADAGAHEACCRVTNRQATLTSAGSGTLVDVAPDGVAGLVLTCAHLFADGACEMTVEFADGARHRANLIAIDRAADLAALEIAAPRSAPARVAIVDQGELASRPQAYRACGFGGDGRLNCVTGRFVGPAGSAERVSFRFSGAVRSGDSGGGVFDDEGRLVAVVWGAAEGTTYASGGAPLRRFLDRLLGERTERTFARRPAPTAPSVCPDGRCPLTAPGAERGSPAGQGPAIGDDSGARQCVCAQQWSAMGERLRSLEDDLRQAARLEQLRDYARVDDVTRLAEEHRAERASLAARIPGLLAGGHAGRAAGALAVGALGISGPVGWAVVAGGAATGLLIGRLMRTRSRRRARARRDEPEPPPQRGVPAERPEATAAAARPFPRDESAADRAAARGEHAESLSPVERDDREARQLLRLSQLEGRDPLQDAVAGRLALDRLDAIADGDDSPRRTWADQLRRELRERFNDIAPTNFQPFVTA
ncbi:MAG: trypsin-like peptidase domain-containing protein [Pirellulales bacterium]|nr:trypsin-like peptidase domain-containing protein [Pirellulales bacterium]